jgi:hypothetical protein
MFVRNNIGLNVLQTTLSYTQSLQYYTGATTYDLNFFNSYPLTNGTPVSLGFPGLTAP